MWKWSKRAESTAQGAALGDRQGMEGKGGKEWLCLTLTGDLEEEWDPHEDNEFDFTHVYVNQTRVCVCVCTRTCVCWDEGEIIRLRKKIMAVHNQVINGAPN